MRQRIALDVFLATVARPVALLLLVAVAGCGARDEIRAPTGKISALVSNVADAAHNQTAFEGLFAAGAAPAESERPRYAKYLYRMQSPDVSGDTVTTTVEIIDAATDDIISVVEWTAVEEGGQWKLKTAPLP
jgi:hypothetical protein